LIAKKLRTHFPYFGENNQSFGKSLGFFEKATHHFKKASILLKLHLKSLLILEKASISLKKSSERIEIFIKTSHF
jgi:hypothetical protein